MLRKVVLLQISFASTSILSFRWASTPVTFAVQAETDFDVGNWVTLTNTPLFTNGSCQVQLPVQPGLHFYRLVLSP